MTSDNISDEKRAAIADVLLLQQLLRQFNSFDELGYFLANETSKVVEYRTAVFWYEGPVGGRLESVSGIPFPASDAPFTHWISQVCDELTAQDLTEPTAIDVDSLSPAIVNNWGEFLPSNGLWVPLISPSGKKLGALLFAKDKSWSVEEKGLLEYWGGASAHAIESLLNRRTSILDRLSKYNKPIIIGIAVFIFLILWMPVSMTVLAPAEVVPKEPFVVRAPIDSVVRRVYVKPNQVVEKGQLLLDMDDTSLFARRDVSTQELQIAQAEFRRAEQASVGDRDAASQLPMLRASIEQKEAEVSYINRLLKRTHIYSEIDGIAILSDVHEIEGKPVIIGEKLLTIANPEMAVLELWVMIEDSIPLPADASVIMFLNVKPGDPLDATLDYVNYQAELSPEGLLAFRARANFTNQSALPRIGWRGTAKIYGYDTSLYSYIFRRPYSAVRQWLGI